MTGEESSSTHDCSFTVEPATHPDKHAETLLASERGRRGHMH